MSLHPLLQCESYVIPKTHLGANAFKVSILNIKDAFFQLCSIINLFLNTTYFLVISFVLLFRSTERATNREYIIYFVLAVTIINDWI